MVAQNDFKPHFPQLLHKTFMKRNNILKNVIYTSNWFYHINASLANCKNESLLPEAAGAPLASVTALEERFVSICVSSFSALRHSL